MENHRKQPVKELETRVTRTYRGGRLLDEFLGKEHPQDTFAPEDWISSFVEAKNKICIQHEGITVVEDGSLITDMIDVSDFGEGRTEPGVLVKLLDSSERLGIQVHPTDEDAGLFFHSWYGKTECWHILGTRDDLPSPPVIYLGFQEWVTKDIWRDLFDRQDVAGMLHAMHAFEVRRGDTILVKGGMPHAIGAGCFLLEIQQPSDYTLRVETTTVAGEELTPQQIHYGIGEEHMLDCFDYTPRTRTQIQSECFLGHPAVQTSGGMVTELVNYADTPYFKLTRIEGDITMCEPSFVTVIALEDGGRITSGSLDAVLHRGDKYFVPCRVPVTLSDSEVLVCYPPDIAED